MCVEGDDEQSSKLVESFSDSAVSQLIDKANCVALLLPVKRSGTSCLIPIMFCDQLYNTTAVEFVVYNGIVVKYNSYSGCDIC